MLKKVFILIYIVFSIEAKLFSAEMPSHNQEDTKEYSLDFDHTPASYDAQALVHFVLNPERPVLESYFPGYREYKKFIHHYLELLEPQAKITHQELAEALVNDLITFSSETGKVLLEAFLLACLKLKKLSNSLVESIHRQAHIKEKLYIINYLIQHRVTQNATIPTHIQTRPNYSSGSHEFSVSEILTLGAYQ